MPTGAPLPNWKDALADVVSDADVLVSTYYGEGSWDQVAQQLTVLHQTLTSYLANVGDSGRRFRAASDEELDERPFP
jgi:hypothetical protein